MQSQRPQETELYVKFYMKFYIAPFSVKKTHKGDPSLWILIGKTRKALQAGDKNPMSCMCPLPQPTPLVQHLEMTSADM